MWNEGIDLDSDCNMFDERDILKTSNSFMIASANEKYRKEALSMMIIISCYYLSKHFFHRFGKRR